MSASGQVRNLSAAEDTASVHASCFCGRSSCSSFDEQAVAQATDIGHRVLVALFIRRVTGTLEIDHYFFPAFSIGRDDRLCLRFRHDLPEPDACHAIVPPFMNIILHGAPPHQTTHDHLGLFCIPVGSQYSHMAL